jgi:hypothetical protein
MGGWLLAISTSTAAFEPGAAARVSRAARHAAHVRPSFAQWA